MGMGILASLVPEGFRKIGAGEYGACFERGWVPVLGLSLMHPISDIKERRTPLSFS